MSRFILTLFSIILSITVALAQIPIALTPSWVTPVRYSTAVSDTAETSGSYFLLVESQDNLGTREHYYRKATKVITEKGLEYVSEISVNYDPSFQKLTFHSAIIRRGDQTINKLKNSKFEILRREESLDRLVYDKSLDAILNLDDVQVGDIIEFSYSVRGSNPVFNNKFSNSIYLAYSSPIAKRYVRVISPAGRPIQYKLFNSSHEPVKSTENNSVSYVWDVDGVPGVLSEDRVPSWREYYPNVEISEYQSWKQVSQWALPLYSTKSVVAPEVEKKVSQIRDAYAHTEEQINACIRFVQDEIRYLSFSDGIQGYKPHHPAQVFKQRFGDCKDKSFLLAFMLRKLGVQSAPALVNSVAGKSLPQSLPSPFRFDHCITQFVFHDSTYWVDPTMTLQRGALKARVLPDYANALLIAENAENLTAVSFSPSTSRIRVEEDFTLDKVGGEAKLVVRTTYHGDDANNIRNYWKSNSPAETKKSYTEFYANEYPDIRADANVAFVDDDSSNVINVTERYTIDKFWKYDSSEAHYRAEFYPRVIAGYLTTPTSKNRSQPLEITHPVSIDQIIIIHLPTSWTIKETQKTISSEAFFYSSHVTYSSQANTLSLSYGYQSLRSEVEASKSLEHIAKISDAKDDLGHQLTSGGNIVSTDTKGPINTPFIIVLVVGAFLFFGIRKILRR